MTKLSDRCIVISIDTNLLFFAANPASHDHQKAVDFLTEAGSWQSVLISEFVLTELYGLLRNPAVRSKPLSAEAAVQLIGRYRAHPQWQVVGFPTRSAELHDALWQRAALPNFARRRLYDARLALSLRSFGVTDFATANVKDFQDFGFSRVWNPCE